MSNYYYNLLNKKGKALYKTIYEDLVKIETTSKSVLRYRNKDLSEEYVLDLVERLLYDNVEVLNYLIPSDIEVGVDRDLITVEVSNETAEKTDMDAVEKIVRFVGERMDEQGSVKSAVTALIAYYRNHGFIYSLQGERSAEKSCFRLLNLVKTNYGCCTPLAELSKIVLDKLGFDCYCVCGEVKHRNPKDNEKCKHLWNGVWLEEWGEYGYFDITSYLPISNKIIRREESMGHFRERYRNYPVGVRIVTKQEFQRRCDFHEELRE